MHPTWSDNHYYPCSHCAADGLCAIDIQIIPTGGGDTDVVSFAAIRGAAQHIIEDCVEGSQRHYAANGGIERHLGTPVQPLVSL